MFAKISIGAVLCASLIAIPMSAEAQRSRALEASALDLARICVSEAGWTCWESGDGLAIHEVILRGAARHGMRYVTFARAYSSRATGQVPTTQRPWIGQLRSDGREPQDWPTEVSTRCAAGVCDVIPHPPWRSFRSRWIAVLERAREVVASFDLQNIETWGLCSEPAEDWGGSMDRHRAERIGLIPVECGETRNDFYRRP